MRNNKIIDFDTLYKDKYNFVMLTDEEFQELYQERRAEVMANEECTKVYFNSESNKKYFSDKNIEIQHN